MVSAFMALAGKEHVKDERRMESSLRVTPFLPTLLFLLFSLLCIVQIILRCSEITISFVVSVVFLFPMICLRREFIFHLGISYV